MPMLLSYWTVRNLRRKWNYERKFLHTYSKQHMIYTLDYYKDMNLTSQCVLLSESSGNGGNRYYASSCEALSKEAINYIKNIIDQKLYRKGRYVIDEFFESSFEIYKENESPCDQEEPPAHSSLTLQDTVNKYLDAAKEINNDSKQAGKMLDK